MPSPAGPVESSSSARLPPMLPGSNAKQSLAFLRDPLSFHLGAARRSGDVWRLKLAIGGSRIVMTSHPDHAKSLFTAKPTDAPSLTGESPLRPVLGPSSVLTLTGDQHLRQRKLLLPPFHGEAIKRYLRMIREIAEREIDSWPLGRPFALGPRMQAVTLQVIMGGIFGSRGALNVEAASIDCRRPCAGCFASPPIRCGCWSKPATPAARTRVACCAPSTG